MYQLSRTVPVNEPKKSFLSRHDVWTGLLMKANNALPYVPEMKKCDVVEQGDGWLIRDIMLKDVPLREKVTFEPEQRVIFERTRGSELGRIENVIGEDANGNLTLTFAFSLKKDGVPEGSEAEKAHFAPMEGAYLGAVASTLAAVRRTVDEKGREHLPPKHPTDTAGDTRWIYDYYRAVDSMNMERTLAQHTDDTTLNFANYPTVHGKEGYKAAIGASLGKNQGHVAQHDRSLVDPRRAGRYRRGHRAIHPPRRQPVHHQVLFSAAPARRQDWRLAHLWRRDVALWRVCFALAGRAGHSGFDAVVK